MERKFKPTGELDPKKKSKMAAMERTAPVKSTSEPYAARRDSTQGSSIPYAATLQGEAYSPTGPKKVKAESRPEIQAEKKTAPYLAGRDEVKEPAMPYAARLQTGGYPQGKPQTIKTESTAAEKAGKTSTPYIAQRDEAKPGVPYAAGLQPEIKLKSPTAMPEDSEKVGSWQKKKTPSRTSIEIREELETLEERYYKLIQEAGAWENQAGMQSTPEEMSQWAKRGRDSRKEAAALEPYLDALQKEWEYAMDWEWEAWKKQEGYRDPTLWDLTVGSFQQGYDTSQFGKESYLDMLGDENNRKAEFEEKLAGEEYKFIPEEWWQKGLSEISSWLGGESYKATSPETLATAGGFAGTVALAGQVGPLAAIPEEVATVPGAAIAGYQVGSVETDIKVQAGLAYDAMLKNGVSKETAGDIAMIIGGINGVIDIVPIDSLIGAIKILDDSGAPEKAIKLVWNELEKRGADKIVETILKTEAQEGIAKAGVGIGTKLETGKWAPDPEKTENVNADTMKENPWISDHATRKLLEDQRMLDYLARWGGLKLRKGMKLEERISAVKKATDAVIRKQKKDFSHSGVKKIF